MNNNEIMTFYGSYSLLYWINLLLGEDIKLPSYQRQFVWNINMIIELYKTIKQGYYVPSILIAKSSINGENCNLILDGQQRLTSILLCYLGVCPNEILDGDNEKQISWQYENLIADIKKTGTISLISDNEFKKIRELLIDSKKYISFIDEKVKKECENEDKIILKEIYDHVDDNFFEEKMLGYSYIKFERPNEHLERKAYAHIFKTINTSGKALSSIEGRRALYWTGEKLNNDFEPVYFFEPEFTNKIKVNDKQFDFAELLAFVAEYYKNNNDVAKGYGYLNRRENYIEDYIENVMFDDEDERFGKFSKIVKNPKDRINEIEKIYNEHIIKWKKEFSSIVDSQYCFFGLLYIVIYQNKNINWTDSLQDKIEKAIDNHKKLYKFGQYNQISKINIRLKESVGLYGEFIIEE